MLLEVLLFILIIILIYTYIFNGTIKVTFSGKGSVNKLKISDNQASKLANDFNLNLDVIPLKWWKKGIEVELEHGSKLGKITNITNNELKTTAKIALAHLIEDPYYYQRLEKMEKEAELYWQTNPPKPIIFL